MKLYTKTGDTGTSSLYNGIRLSKTSIHFKLLGDIDELNSHIGMAKSLWKQIIDTSDVKVYSAPGAGAMFYRDKPSTDTNLYYEWYNINILTEIQCTLMDISTFIATPPWHENKKISGDVFEHIEKWISKVGFDKHKIKKIESWIDRFDELCPPIKNFVVPGNNVLVSSVHICRTVSRRCERLYIEYLQSDLICYRVYSSVDEQFDTIEIYLNRLSDFFFALSRFLAHSQNVQEDHYSRQRGEIF